MSTLCGQSCCRWHFLSWIVTTWLLEWSIPQDTKVLKEPGTGRLSSQSSANTFSGSHVAEGSVLLRMFQPHRFSSAGNSWSADESLCGQNVQCNLDPSAMWESAQKQPLHIYSDPGIPYTDMSLYATFSDMHDFWHIGHMCTLLATGSSCLVVPQSVHACRPPVPCQPSNLNCAVTVCTYSYIVPFGTVNPEHRWLHVTQLDQWSTPRVTVTSYS